MARESGQLVPFGKYLLDEEIASGGMARVFRARLRGLGGFEKTLVVKQVRRELASDPKFLSLFVREANVLVQMSHPHIVPVYELGVVDGTYFLAMEYVEGATLAELLEFERPFPPELAFRVGEQIADALAYAHTQFELIHRDVTPNNIMVDRTGHVRLLDFGIAAPAYGPTEGGVYGSVGYMAPEQARGDTVSPASDLFGLGAVLYEALTGENPFHREDRKAALEVLLAQDATPLPLGPGPTWLPAKLRLLVESLVQRDASKRPQSAATVATALRSWLAAEHPEGVTQQLANLVAQAQARRSIAASPEDATALDGELAHGSGDTKSIATSTTLAAMLTPAHGHSAVFQGHDGVHTAPVTGRMLAAAQASVDAAVRSAARNTSREPAGKPHRRWWGLAAALLTLAAGLTYWAALAPGPTAPALSQPLLRKPEREVTPQPDPRPTAQAVVTAPEARTGPTTPSTAVPAQATGTLMISAIPWAQVSLNHRTLGETSRRQLDVPAGRHTVSLSCPPLGTQARIPIEVPPNGRVVIIADMTTDPPTIRQQL